MGGAERRAHPRLETDLACMVDGTVEGRIRNVSVGGALLVGPLGLATVDDVVSIEIQRDASQPLELFSDVVRVGLQPSGKDAEYGLRFLIQDGRFAEIDRWLRQLPKLDRKAPAAAAESRRVKGTLFVDYVRMVRSQKMADWSKHLRSEDLAFLQGRIDLAQWYPMETFERMGVAILAEVAQGNLLLARAWGQSQVEGLCQLHSNLLAVGDPRDSLMRFSVLRNSFFDYPSIEILHVSDGEAAVTVKYGMGPVAEEAASIQTMGFFERLVELSGGRSVSAWFSSESWKGAPITTMELRWEV